jgi:hypothetical protein
MNIPVFWHVVGIAFDDHTASVISVAELADHGGNGGRTGTRDESKTS